MSINPLNIHYAIENPASIYDEEAMTALELAGRTTAKVNECVEVVNKTVEDLPNKVEEAVQVHIDGGAFDGQIDTYAENLKQQVKVTNKRIDNLAKLEDGSTTGDAELIDIRLGVDGETDDTAGEAVRRQIGNLPYPKRVIADTTVNLDDLKEPGIYVFDSCEFVNLPYVITETNTSPHYCKVEYIKRNLTYPWVKQTIGYYSRPVEYNRMFMNTVWKPWRSSLNYLESTGDNTNRADEINQMLAWHKYVKLGPGDFYVNQIRIPAGAMLVGCGALTRIINDGTTASTVVLNSKATIKNVSIVGEWTSQPDYETSEQGNKIGITVNGETENCVIDGCFISGFSYAGIYLDNTGTACRSAVISNCDICHCWVGLYIQRSEYCCVSNCVMRDNNIGCYNLGGNNKFSACGFDTNNYGFIVSGDTNNGHGCCVACTFNHNIRSGISLQKVDWGFLFSACQVHYSKITTLATTKGVIFNGCNFGGNVPIDSSCKTPLFFIGCGFYETPWTVEGYLDEFNTTKYVDCFNWTNGEQLYGPIIGG